MTAPKKDDGYIEFDLNDLTIGEIETIEELSGEPIDALGQAGRPKGKALRAVAYVIRRRTNSEFTWEQAGELRVKLTADEQDPTAASV